MPDRLLLDARLCGFYIIYCLILFCVPKIFFLPGNAVMLLGNGLILAGLALTECYMGQGQLLGYN